MKFKIIILSFLITLSSFSQEFTGWNNVLPTTQKLLNGEGSNPVRANVLSSYLATNYEDERKIMRFPAGTGGKTYFYDRIFTEKVIRFYKDAGVKYVTLVVNPSDLEGFKKTYEAFSNDFTILLVEYDNENYLKSHLNQLDKSPLEVFWFVFNRNYYYGLKTKEYVKSFVDFKTWAKDNNITAPIGAVCQLPDNNFGKYWFSQVSKVSNNLIIHIYGEELEKKDYWVNASKALDLMENFNVYVTESSSIHFGDNLQSTKNEQYAYTAYHRSQDLELKKVLNKPQVKMSLRHSLFDLAVEYCNNCDEVYNLYAQFIVNDFVIENRLR